MNKKKLLVAINKFSQKKILVIGDLILDRFVWGKVSRISPEAPVPVVEVKSESGALGGAGNVANNITAFGAQVSVIGVYGADQDGQLLKEELTQKRISTKYLVQDSARPTIVKTRIIASHQQVVRVDKEVKGNFSNKIIDEIVSKITNAIKDVDAVIISDYGKGVINIPVLKKAITLAKKSKIPITVDPKIEHFLYYKGVSCITPNTSEAIAGMRYKDVSQDKDIVELGKKILKTLKSESVLITRSEKGMTLFEPNNKTTHIPTRAREVFDVTGAGDTVIATFTLALATGLSLAESAEIANFAAGIVVAKVGTATASLKELKTVISEFNEKK